MYLILWEHKKGIITSLKGVRKCSLLNNLLNKLELKVEDQELIKNSLEVYEYICPAKQKKKIDKRKAYKSQGRISR